MNYFGNLYTLIEIAINNNISEGDLIALSRFLNNKDLYSIKEKYPELSKFIPYCKWYVIQGRNVLAMSAYLYDIYKQTGLLPNIKDVDINPSTEKLEHWEYINPLVFEINPEEGFEFAEKIFENCNIWNLFLSGSARMDYYEGKNVTLEQRIKYAIVEYMMRRPQFYTTEDFVDNEILHKKYKKKEGEMMSSEIIYVCNSINNKKIRENELNILRKIEEQYCFEFGENEMNLKKRFYNTLEELNKDYEEVKKLKEKIEKKDFNSGTSAVVKTVIKPVAETVVKTIEVTKKEEDVSHKEQDLDTHIAYEGDINENRDRRYRRRNIF